MKKLLLLSIMLLAFGSMSAQTDRNTTTTPDATTKDKSTVEQKENEMTTTTTPQARKGTTMKGEKLKKSTSVDTRDKRNPDGTRSESDDRTGTNGRGTTTGTTGTAPSPNGTMPAN